MKKIINIYIFKEMIPNFTTSLFVFTFLILAGPPESIIPLGAKDLTLEIAMSGGSIWQ